MKVIFESHGRFKLTEKWLHKNVLYLHQKNCNLRKRFLNINKKDKFFTEKKISGC